MTDQNLHNRKAVLDFFEKIADAEKVEDLDEDTVLAVKREEIQKVSKMLKKLESET